MRRKDARAHLDLSYIYIYNDLTFFVGLRCGSEQRRINISKTNTRVTSVAMEVASHLLKLFVATRIVVNCGMR